MDAPLISIRNSKGIIVPKVSIRKGWGKFFKKMHENGDDKPLISDVFKSEKI